MARKDPGRGLPELARALRAARAGAGVLQVDAAKRAKMSQNKISRIENGQGIPTVAEATRLLRAYGTGDQERDRVLELVSAARTEYVDARFILQRGAHHFQERLRLLAANAQRVRGFAPTAVIGYLQTRQYIETVFTQRMTPEQAAPSIANRLKQQSLVDDPKRQWVMLMTEGALRWNLGGPQVMVDQIQAIADAVDRPNVTIGLIPYQVTTMILPTHGFHIYDQAAVIVGTRSGTAIIKDSNEIASYEALYEQLEGLAVFGDDLLAELERIATEYRALRD